MKLETNAIIVRITTAQDKELDKLCERLELSKAALVREAVTILISNYNRMFENAENLDKVVG